MEPDGVFTWLIEQSKAGRADLGISGHNLTARFPKFLETGEVDVLLAAVNFVDRHTYNFEETVLPVARKHGVGIVAMKVFGGAAGGEYKNPKGPHIGIQHVASALRYALSLPGVVSANLGVHSPRSRSTATCKWSRTFDCYLQKNKPSCWTLARV